MRELDVLLAGWLDRHFAAADTAARTAFSDLLALSNPELIALVLGGRQAADPRLEELLAQIRRDT